ncbi:SAYSvFN domain containing protein [Trichuris trichiura]|uniref:SAYSvFN domain containing protein n=1 Tax=Trichuris trichiura TaxID=36087 RepID=A0A077Z817_TRITR|nr:SAYSvFN domain containing protein [Trichuris trichiura]
MESVRAELEEYRRKKTILCQQQKKPIEKAVVKENCEEPVRQIEEVVEESDTAEVKATVVDRLQKILLFTLLWLLLLSVAIYVEFGCVYALSSAFVILWLNTSRRKKQNEAQQQQLSAYSVFNPNCERLPGQITAEHFEDMYRRGGGLI